MASPILVRFGVADITPPEALPLGGYTARKGALGVLGDEKLHARCLMLEQGDEPPIFVVSVDLLTAPESLVEAVKAKMPKGELILAATHTHSAPDSQMLNKRMNFAIPGIASFNQRWLDWYAERIASACDLAVAMKPMRADELAYRAADVDANRGRREGAQPIKNAFRLESTDGVALLASYAAHGTIYEEDSVKISGDWPAAWAEKLNCPVLVGAIGDVSPAPEGTTPEEKIKSMVEKLQGGLEKTPVKVISEEKLFLHFNRCPIELGEVVPHPKFASSFGAPDALANMIVKKFAPEKAEITAFSIGDVAVVGIPGELCSSLGRQVVEAGAKAGFAQTIIVSHANGWIGYILDPEDYDKGGYEATLSFHGREIGLRVVKAAAKALSDLAAGTGPTDSRADSSHRTRRSEAA
jgi:hypothetical protein